MGTLVAPNTTLITQLKRQCGGWGGRYRNLGFRWKGFYKIRGTLLGVPIIRTIVYLQTVGFTPHCLRSTEPGSQGLHKSRFTGHSYFRCAQGPWRRKSQSNAVKHTAHAHASSRKLLHSRKFLRDKHPSRICLPELTVEKASSCQVLLEGYWVASSWSNDQLIE